MKRLRNFLLACLMIGIALRFYEPLAYDSGTLHSIVRYPERSFGKVITTQFSYAFEDMVSLIPESVQTWLGLHLFLSSFTPGLSESERDSIRSRVAAIYDEMGREPGWKRLPSVMGSSALGLLQIQPQRFHMFYYVPSTPAKPEKLLIFFHGSLGNLTAYVKLWAAYADATGTVIACPSQGFGDWSKTSGVTEKVLAALPEPLRMAPDHIIFAGLSAGGYAATEEAVRHPEARGLIYISAAITDRLTQTSGLAARWGGKPILVFYGGRDALVTMDYTQSRLKAMEQAGLYPAVSFLPKASHFLLLSDTGRVMEELRKAFGD